MNNLTGAFPKTRRLTKSSGFKRVFKTETRSEDNNFLVLARKNGQDYAKLGLAISKRNVKTAVGRNRIKRVIRESFRKNQDKVTGLDVVVVSRKKTGASSNNELIDSLESHWKKISSAKNINSRH